MIAQLPMHLKMYRIIRFTLYACLITFSTSLYSQDKAPLPRFTYQVQAGPAVMFFYPDAIHKQVRFKLNGTLNNPPGMGFFAGAAANVRVWKNIHYSAGLRYQKWQMKASYDYPPDPDFTCHCTYSGSVKKERTLIQTHPLSIKYITDRSKKADYFFGGGYTLDFLVYQSGTSVKSSPGEGGFYYEDDINWRPDQLTSVSSGYDLAAGIIWKTGKKFELITSLSFNRNIGSQIAIIPVFTNIGEVDFDYSSLSLQLGLKF
ncbi:MAG: hypothetical protein M3Q97_02830 [Bacteroidota bacterium]|nr:hypothetical protein [Bacteroidota bacterium]